MKHAKPIIVIMLFLAIFFSCMSAEQNQPTNPEEVQADFSPIKSRHVNSKKQVRIFSDIAVDEPIWVRPGELINIGQYHHYQWTGENEIDWRIEFEKAIVNESVIGLTVMDDEIGITNSMSTLYRNSIKSIVIFDCDRPHLSSNLLKGIEIVSAEAVSITINGLLNNQLNDLSSIKNKVVGLRVQPQYSSNCLELTDFENLRMLEIFVNKTYADPKDISRCLEFLPALKKLQQIRIEGMHQLSNEDVYSLSRIDNLKSLQINSFNQGDVDLSELERINSLLFRADHSEFNLSGLEQLNNLKELSLRGIFVNDDFLESLHLPENLRELELNSCSIEPIANNLDFLQGVESLEKLFLFITMERDNITPLSPYVALKNLTNLKYLRMPFDPLICDQDLKNIETLSELRSLELSSYKVSNDGLRSLQNLKKLRFLKLANRKIEEVDFGFIEHATDLEVLEYQGNYKKQVQIYPGISKLSNLRVLKLRALIGLNDYYSLSGLNKLQMLIFPWRDYFSNRSEVIEKMQDLEVLDLSFQVVQSDSLKSVSKLKSLRVLNLTSSKIDSQGLKHLGELLNLQNINLRKSNISDEGVQHLSSINSLETIDLGETNISDKGVQYLENMSSLRELTLYNTDITDKALHSVGKIKGLLRLDLSLCTKITGNGVIRLDRLTELRYLGLEHTQVDDKLVPVVYQLPLLKNLIISGTKVTCPAYFELRKKLRLYVTVPKRFCD